MLSAGLLAVDDPEPESELRCRCGHPRSAHGGPCRVGHENRTHLLAEVRQAARRHRVSAVRLGAAVLRRMGEPCGCKKFETGWF